MKTLITISLWLIVASLQAQPAVVVSGASQIQGSIRLDLVLGPLATNPPSGSGVWVRSLPAGFNVFTAGITADSANNALVVGAFTTSINMGGGVSNSIGGLDGFLAKYDVNNNLVWGKTFGGTSDDRALGVAADSTGNIFICGFFKKSITFGAITLTATDPFNIGTSDMFVVKYSSAGVVQWAKGYGSSSDDTAISIAVDGSGNPIFTGSFFGTVSFGGIPLTSTAGTSDFVVSKMLSTDGSTTWAIGHGGSTSDVAAGVAVDSLGNAIAVGHANGAIDLGGGSVGTGGGYIAKYSAAAGAYVWGRVIPVNTIGGVAVEQSSGKVFTTGGFPGPTDFGNGVPISTRNGGGGVFIAVYNNAAGAYVAAKVYAITGDLGQGIAVDASSNVAITGTADGLIDFTGTGIFTSGKGYFVNVMDTSLVNRWFDRSSQPVNHGYAVAFDSTHALATGGFQGTEDFNGISATAPVGLQYGFVAQYIK